MKKNLVIGIDIGGTKTNIAAISPQGEIINIKKISSSSENPELLKNNIIKEISNLTEKQDHISGIGIATAGRVSFSQKKILHKPSNLKGWENIDIVSILENKFTCPVYIDNDVNTALLSELKLNDVPEKSIVIFIAIGTGLGGALAINGNIIRGNTGSVGEFGHIILYPEGKECNCGKKGCVEQYISGTAYRNRLKTKLKKSGIKYNDQDLSISTIEKNIFANKKPYITVLKNMTQDLALLLDSLKYSLDYDLCIIGGGFHVYKDIILKELDREFSSSKYKYINSPSIVFSKQKNEAGVIGAGLMVYKNLIP